MKKLQNFVKNFFLALLFLSMFNIMSVGINVDIPITLITLLIIAVFEVPGFIMLIIFYMFIL